MARKGIYRKYRFLCDKPMKFPTNRLIGALLVPNTVSTFSQPKNFVRAVILQLWKSMKNDFFSILKFPHTISLTTIPVYNKKTGFDAEVNT